MITINGRKMGKSYNNVIKLTELFSGDHPLLEKAYSPMTVRFFILQTHYRSTLDFGNEAPACGGEGFEEIDGSF
jgi:cysteinyl-tRNA synthetase